MKKKIRFKDFDGKWYYTIVYVYNNNVKPKYSTYKNLDKK